MSRQSYQCSTCPPAMLVAAATQGLCLHTKHQALTRPRGRYRIHSRGQQALQCCQLPRRPLRQPHLRNISRQVAFTSTTVRRRGIAYCAVTTVSSPMCSSFEAIKQLARHPDGPNMNLTT